MDDKLVVLMSTRVAGTIQRFENNLLRFDYDAGYQSSRGATPISLSMPLAVKTHADVPARRVVSNFLTGLLPDDTATTKRWAGFYKVRTSSPFFLLGTPVGRDCAGAISFCPPEELPALLARGGRVTWLNEAQVADLLRDLRRDPTNVLGRDFAGQFSLAGAQAKIALVYDEPTQGWGRPFGTEATNRILKPASAGWTDQDINEHICLAAAGRAGLIVARSEIRHFGDQEVIVSHRYDRARTPNGLARIHQEDLCQAMGIAPDNKYENSGGPSVRSIAGLFRRVMRPANAQTATRTFADALIWNWLICGTDAHAKNYSMLLSGGQARLAPLYDVSSILPYIGTRSPIDGRVINERQVNGAMKIGGRYEYVPVLNTWPKAAADLGIDAGWLVARAKSLVAAAPGAFAAAAADPGIAAHRSQIARDLVDRVAERCARCANALG